MASIFEIKTASDSQSFVKNNPRGIIFYGSKTCGHCIAMKPYINEMAAKYPKIAFAHVEVSEVKVDKLGSGVPVFIGYYKGKAVDKVVGANKSGVAKMIAKISYKS
jgi:thiol-disulfide isomerase/thioredoxin